MARIAIIDGRRYRLTDSSDKPHPDESNIMLNLTSHGKIVHFTAVGDDGKTRRVALNVAAVTTVEFVDEATE